VYGLERHYPLFCLALYISMGIELWAGTVTIFDLNRTLNQSKFLNK
jgi:hypothetical protein